jgi:hypothetical protein
LRLMPELLLQLREALAHPHRHRREPTNWCNRAACRRSRPVIIDPPPPWNHATC